MSTATLNAPTVLSAHDFVAFLGDADSVDLFRQFAKRQMIASAHVQRGSVFEAVRFVEKQARSPRLLVVDITGVGMPLPAIDRLAEVCEPGVSVVVIGDQQDVSLFRQLLAIGVADYLVKPLTIEVLLQVIGGDLKLASARRSARTGKLVTITGARGGVGATSLATSLAWLIANRHHRRVAFVDLDTHGGGGPLLLDLEVGGLAEALANAPQQDALLLDRALVRQGERLFCLSAENDFDAEAPLDAEALDRLLVQLEQQFHYVILDLPRRPGPLYRFALQRAAVQVVVVDRTLPAVHNAVRMLPLLAGDKGRAVYVLNEHQPSGHSPLDRDSIERSLGRGFDLVVPFDRTAPDRGDNLGEPLAAGRGPFATAVRHLAADLSGRQLAQPRGWRRFLGRA